MSRRNPFVCLFVREHELALCEGDCCNNRFYERDKEQPTEQYTLDPSRNEEEPVRLTLSYHFLVLC